MKNFFNWEEHWNNLRHLLVSTGLAVPVALLAGTASAGFLWSLEQVTRLRWEHGWLLFLLPMAGLAVGLLYHFLGGRAEAGNESDHG